MSFLVYGIRIRDTADVRYIGQTGRSLQVRLAGHYSEFLCWLHRPPFKAWALDNRANIEIFEISRHETRAEARAAEAAAAKMALTLGHQLFNIKFVPKAQQFSRRADAA